MLKIESPNDLANARYNLSSDMYRFILHWYQRVYHDDDPQYDLYGIPQYIGSLGAMWIAQTDKEVRERELLDSAKFQLQGGTVYVGTFFTVTGECVDLFIPSNILEQSTQAMLDSIITRIFTIEGVERID